MFGRSIYAIGGNEEASRLSGVPVRFHKTGAYVVCGLTSGVAAVVLTARLNSAQPTAGIMYELDAIAATVIGGTSLFGGEGTLVGALIGALIMGVLRNGLNLLNVSSFVQQFVHRRRHHRGRVDRHGAQTRPGVDPRAAGGNRMSSRLKARTRRLARSPSDRPVHSRGGV